MTASPKHVAIVGGGIAGLATAHALHACASRAGLPLTCSVIEAAHEWGGKIMTHTESGLVIEAGPDSFLSQKPWALDLCRQLQLDDQLINTNPLSDRVFVFSRGRLRPLPDGLVMMVPTKVGSFLRSGLLSWSGMARMAMDLVISPKHGADIDESLASFFRRRLGREAFERFIEPLMAGIYAGDAEHMSLRATFPKFLDMERDHRSVIRGVLATRAAQKAKERTSSADSAGSDARTMFVTLRDGLYSLTNALVARLEHAGMRLRLAQRVATIRPRSASAGGMGYSLLFENNPLVSADAVVLATPAFVAGELIRGLCSGAADLLGEIPYASTATVALAYNRADLGSGVKGFGFVVPRVERRDLLAATWTSQKWSHRTPPAQSLVRCYVGGVGREQIVMADDHTITQRVKHELKDMAGITANPIYAEVNRWERGMPQYTLGHLDRLAKIEESIRLHPGLYLTGAGYHGIGIPDCIRDGTETAERVVRDLLKRTA